MHDDEPLTVSRFLPPEYSFDVVIFDEASQVRTEDAINCVYRGKSLIVAGDQKQLPPTDFFGSAQDGEDGEYDEDEPARFESLLDQSKASGKIRSLSLRWHYRSRHEDLITFSNRRFYNDELITFPGALEHGDDVGVTFTK
ncbi:AAA domain-containing protein [Actinomadura flavalba]|uniref:AAA domain-containing protein n=1 Tax=Actinomadura flavalba TaxID=1120938 RepID=UPI00035F4290|nr:AAA domain-containing protein [Actinomadura flavalba]